MPDNNDNLNFNNLDMLLQYMKSGGDALSAINQYFNQLIEPVKSLGKTSTQPQNISDNTITKFINEFQQMFKAREIPTALNMTTGGGRSQVGRIQNFMSSSENINRLVQEVMGGSIRNMTNAIQYIMTRTASGPLEFATYNDRIEEPVQRETIRNEPQQEQRRTRTRQTTPIPQVEQLNQTRQGISAIDRINKVIASLNRPVNNDIITGVLSSQINTPINQNRVIPDLSRTYRNILSMENTPQLNLDNAINIKDIPNTLNDIKNNTIKSLDGLYNDLRNISNNIGMQNIITSTAFTGNELRNGLQLAMQSVNQYSKLGPTTPIIGSNVFSNLIGNQPSGFNVPLYDLQNRTVFDEDLAERFYNPKKSPVGVGSYSNLTKTEMLDVYEYMRPAYTQFSGNRNATTLDNMMSQLEGALGVGRGAGQFNDMINMMNKNRIPNEVQNMMMSDYANVTGQRAGEMANFSSLLTKLNWANLKYTEYEAIPNKTQDQMASMRGFGELSAIYSELGQRMASEINKHFFDALSSFSREMPVGSMIGGQYFSRGQARRGTGNIRNMLSDLPQVGGILSRVNNLMYGGTGRRLGLGYEAERVLGGNIEQLNEYLATSRRRRGILRRTPEAQIRGTSEYDQLRNIELDIQNAMKYRNELSKAMRRLRTPEGQAELLNAGIKLSKSNRPIFEAMPESVQQQQLGIERQYGYLQRQATIFRKDHFQSLSPQEQEQFDTLYDRMITRNQPTIERNRRLGELGQLFNVTQQFAARNPKLSNEIFQTFNNTQAEYFTQSMKNFDNAFNNYFQLRANQVKGIINNWSYVSGHGGISELRRVSSGLFENVMGSLYNNISGIRQAFQTGPALENFQTEFNNVIANIDQQLKTLRGMPETPQRNLEIAQLTRQRGVIGREYQLAMGIARPTIAEGFRYNFARPLRSGLQTFGLMNIQNVQMATMFGLSNVLFQALTQLPSEAAFRVSQPVTTTLGNVTGLLPFYSTLLSFSQNLPQIIDSIQGNLYSLSSLLGSPMRAQQALSTSLQIARTEPIEFPEALSVLTAASIYPETRQYATSNEFQRQLFNSVQLLSMLVPEQGTQGAIFAIREMLGDQYRSLQRRFNISPELIAGSVGMTFPQFRALPANERIMKLGEGLSNLFGGTDVLFQRGSQFSIQLNNLTDTLTRSLVLPLVSQQTPATNEFVNRLSDNDYALLQRSMPERFRALRQTSEENLRRRNITPQSSNYDTSLNQEMQRLFSTTYNSTMGMLSYTVGALGNALDNVFRTLNIGNVFSNFVGSTTEGIRNTIDQFNNELANPDVGKQDAAKRFINNLMDSINQGFSTGMTQIRTSPLGGIISATIGNVGDMMRSAMQMVTTSIVKTVVTTLVSLPGDITSQVVTSVSNNGILDSLFSGLKNTKTPDLLSFGLSGLGTMAGFYSLLTFRSTPQPWLRMLGGFGLAGLARSENFFRNPETNQMNSWAIPATLLFGSLATGGTRGLRGLFGNISNTRLGRFAVNNRLTQGIRNLLFPIATGVGVGVGGNSRLVDQFGKPISTSTSTSETGGRPGRLGPSLTYGGMILSTLYGVFSTLERIETLRQQQRNEDSTAERNAIIVRGITDTSASFAPYISSLLANRGRWQYAPYAIGGLISSAGGMYQNRQMGEGWGRTISQGVVDTLPFIAGGAATAFGSPALGFAAYMGTQLISSFLLTPLVNRLFPSNRENANLMNVSALSDINYDDYIRNLRNTAELGISQFRNQLGPPDLLPEQTRNNLVNLFAARETSNIDVIEQGIPAITQAIGSMPELENVEFDESAQNRIKNSITGFFSSFNDTLKGVDFTREGNLDVLQKQLQIQIGSLIDELFGSLNIDETKIDRNTFRQTLGSSLNEILTNMISNATEATIGYNQAYINAANVIRTNPYAQEYYTRLEPPTLQGSRNLLEFAQKRMEYIPTLLEDTTRMSQEPATFALGIGAISFDQYRNLTTMPGEFFRQAYATTPGVNIPMSLVANPQLLSSVWASFLSSNPTPEQIGIARENIGESFRLYQDRMLELFNTAMTGESPDALSAVATNTGKSANFLEQIANMLKPILGIGVGNNTEGTLNTQSNVDTTTSKDEDTISKSQPLIKSIFNRALGSVVSDVYASELTPEQQEQLRNWDKINVNEDYRSYLGIGKNYNEQYIERAGNVREENLGRYSIVGSTVIPQYRIQEIAGEIADKYRNMQQQISELTLPELMNYQFPSPTLEQSELLEPLLKRPEFTMLEQLNNISNIKLNKKTPFEEFMRPSRDYTQDEKLGILSQIPFNMVNMDNLIPPIKGMPSKEWINQYEQQTGGIVPINQFLNQPIGNLQSQMNNLLGFLPSQISGMLPTNILPNQLISNAGIANNNIAQGVQIQTPIVNIITGS